MAKTNFELNSLSFSAQEQDCLIKIAGDQFQIDKRTFFTQYVVNFGNMLSQQQQQQLLLRKGLKFFIGTKSINKC